VGKRGSDAGSGLSGRDAFWLKHARACEAAGAVAAEYAARHGLSVGAFYEAKRRLTRRGAWEVRQRRAGSSFARVMVREPAPGETAVRVHLPGGAVIEWSSSPALESLVWLIEALGARR